LKNRTAKVEKETRYHPTATRNFQLFQKIGNRLLKKIFFQKSTVWVVKKVRKPEQFKRLFSSNLSFHKVSTTYPQTFKTGQKRSFCFIDSVFFICTLDAERNRVHCSKQAQEFNSTDAGGGQKQPP
jgi:hypothetical protein